MNVRLTQCVCTLILCLVKFLSFNNRGHYLCYDSRSYAIRECQNYKIKFILLIHLLKLVSTPLLFFLNVNNDAPRNHFLLQVLITVGVK